MALHSNKWLEEVERLSTLVFCMEVGYIRLLLLQFGVTEINPLLLEKDKVEST